MANLQSDSFHNHVMYLAKETCLQENLLENLEKKKAWNVKNTCKIGAEMQKEMSFELTHKTVTLSTKRVKSIEAMLLTWAITLHSKIQPLLLFVCPQPPSNCVPWYIFFAHASFLCPLSDNNAQGYKCCVISKKAKVKCKTHKQEFNCPYDLDHIILREKKIYTILFLVLW